MRVTGLLIGVGLLSCATMGSKEPTTPKLEPAYERGTAFKKGEEVKPGRNEKGEVVVVGKTQKNVIPGLRSTEQETEFTIYHGLPYRCTRVKGSPEDPKGVESCRLLSSGMQGNPNTGLIDRYSNNIDSSDRH
jgi:hypothetical protein